MGVPMKLDEDQCEKWANYARESKIPKLYVHRRQWNAFKEAGYNMSQFILIEEIKR